MVPLLQPPASRAPGGPARHPRARRLPRRDQPAGPRSQPLADREARACLPGPERSRPGSDPLPTGSSSRSPATSRTFSSTSSRTTRPTKTPTTAARSPFPAVFVIDQAASSGRVRLRRLARSGPSQPTSSPHYRPSAPSVESGTDNHAGRELQSRERSPGWIERRESLMARNLETNQRATGRSPQTVQLISLPREKDLTSYGWRNSLGSSPIKAWRTSATRPSATT